MKPALNCLHHLLLSFFVVLLLAASATAEPLFCTFNAIVENGCAFKEQAKPLEENPQNPGRATIVPIARHGTRAVQLHTAPGDDNVAGSGLMDRNDLYLTQEDTEGFEGRDQWWAHSIYLPNDFAMPTWHMYVLFDFHNTAPDGQANFHINFAPECDPEHCIPRPGYLIFRGYGGTPDNGGLYTAPIGFVEKNVWYDFVYHVRWSSGSDGFFDAWVRKGNEPMYLRKLAHQGPTLYQKQGVYLKLANYHVPICNDCPSAEGPPSSVIHDRVVRGLTWQEVAMAPLEGQFEEGAASYQSNLTPSSWTPYGSETGSFSGSRMVASSEANATARFTFRGRSVAWMGTKCNVCGIAFVSIDGGAPTPVNTAGPNAPGGLTAEGVFSAAGLAPGVNHTITITVTSGTTTGGTNIAVDGFWVTP